MNNLTHTYIAVLKHLGLLTEEGAKELSKELSSAILPSKPEDALIQVDEAIKKVEKKLGESVKLQPWLSKLESLESRVRQLESTKKK